MNFFLRVSKDGWREEWVGPFATRALAQEAKERLHGINPKWWVAIVQPMPFGKWLKQVTQHQRGQDG